MFLRRTTVTSHGRRYEYVHLVESVRRESDGRPVHRILANLGPMDDVAFENFKVSLDAARAGKRVAVVSAPKHAPAPKPQANLDYLDLAIGDGLWRRWDLDAVMRDLLPRGESEVSAALVVEALVLQRLVAPDSKLAATRWFPRTALPELLGVAPRQVNNTRVHRVLDQLEAVTPALMAKLPRLYREREGAFAWMAMDVTDALFVGSGPDLAVRGKTKVGIVSRKIGIVLLCNQSGYPLRWEVIRGNCSDSVAMTEMAQAISGLEWVGDAPVVLDRAMGKSAQVRALAGTKLRFLTALTRPEFCTYAPGLPWAEVEGLTCADPSELAAEAARCLEAAGMKKVDERLLVLDCGVVEPLKTEEAEVSGAEHAAAPADDPLARAMRTCRDLDQAVRDGRYGSHAAAGAALGLKKSVFTKYRQLLGLTDELQQEVMAGRAAGYPLARLIRIAQLRDPEEQRAAFESLLRSAPGRKGRLLGPKPVSGAAEASVPLRVRVVAYFNPERFVEERKTAAQHLERVSSFVAELNAKLASARAKRSRDQIIAAIDRQLHKDDLIDAFAVSVEEQEVAGARRLHARVELDEAEWGRRRRYDGFSVLVGQAELPHSAPELCQLYRAKDMVEKDFQVIKSVVELRPLRHRTDLKVRAHVTLCALALLLERRLRAVLGGKHSPEAALEILGTCKLNRYRSERGPSVYTITELDAEQRAILRKLRLHHLADDDYLEARITPR